MFKSAFLAVTLVVVSSQAIHALHAEDMVNLQNEPAPATTGAPVEKPHWDYNVGGHSDPSKWATDLGYKDCAKSSQSPINVVHAESDRATSLADLKLTSPSCSSFALVNNGHTWQITLDSAECIAKNTSKWMWKGSEFQLNQIHFHSPSEHRLGGGLFDAEIHMVHKTADGSKLAVLGILVDGSSDIGDGNKFIGDVWKAGGDWKITEGKPTFSKQSFAVDPYHGLLPGSPEYYHYSGSLTTPPCTEGVEWVIMAQPVRMSTSQVAQFRKSMETTDGVQKGNNRRPVQPLNGRKVTYYPAATGGAGRAVSASLAAAAAAFLGAVLLL